MSGPVKLAGVAGWPVGHSLSPAMMAFWLGHAGMTGHYVPFAIPPEGLPNVLKSMGDFGISGMNVTIPHKETALALADETSEAARRIGAANLVLARPGGGVFADNTDIVGVKAALDEGGWRPELGPAVLVGAGGAARAAMAALVEAGAEIRIINRTADRARKLAADFGAEVGIYDYARDAEALDGASLVVNATNLGMDGVPSADLDLSRMNTDGLVFDMVYVPLQTGLIRAARAQGLKTADGLSMLIGQARPAFEAFYGAPPPNEPDVRAHLLRILEARS